MHEIGPIRISLTESEPVVFQGYKIAEITSDDYSVPPECSIRQSFRTYVRKVKDAKDLFVLEVETLIALPGNLVAVRRLMDELPSLQALKERIGALDANDYLPCSLNDQREAHSERFDRRRQRLLSELATLEEREGRNGFG